MNIFKYVLCACVLFVSSTFATQYVSLGGGIDNLELTNSSNSGLKVGYMGSARFGYFLDQYSSRIEVEFSYRRSQFGTQYQVDDKDQVLAKNYRHFHSWSYMLNLHYDINQISVASIVPYLGVGLGYCQNTEHRKIKVDSGTHSAKLRDNRFAYQGIVGLKYPIDETYSTSIEYHYFCGQQHAKSHSVNLLLAKKF